MGCVEIQSLLQWCVFSDSRPTDTTSSKHSVSLTWAGRDGWASDPLQLPLGLISPPYSQRKHSWRTITSAKYKAHIQNNHQTSDLSGKTSCPQRLIGHSLCLQWRDHWAEFPALGLKQGKSRLFPLLERCGTQLPWTSHSQSLRTVSVTSLVRQRSHSLSCRRGLTLWWASRLVAFSVHEL